MIASCKYGVLTCNIRESLSSTTIVTDQGICQAINGLHATEAFKPSKFTRRFNETIQPRMTKVRNTPIGGEYSKLSLMLNSNRMWQKYREAGDIILGISDQFNPFEVKLKGIKLKSGFHHRYKVTPTQYATSDNFRNLDINVRKCRFLDENPDPKSIYSYYSQSACAFECRLRYAQNLTNCIPWDYPTIGEEDWTICDGQFSLLFQFRMEEASCSHCLPDCEELKFQVSESVYVVDPEEVCFNKARPNHEIDVLFLSKLTGENIFLIRLRDLLHKFQLGLNWDEIMQNRNFVDEPGQFWENEKYLTEAEKWKYCHEMVEKDLILVDVEMAEPRLNRYMKQERVTFTDQLGMLGNYLFINERRRIA